MKKFDNLTVNKKESAVKVGSTVPSDAANLAFYSNESLSPKNNLSVVDVSKAIPENTSSLADGIEPFFANELGILEDVYGNTFFPTANLTVSDSLIGQLYKTEILDEYQIDATQFFHYYYVSRFFTAGPPGISFSGLSDYLSENRIKFLNIKVVDSQNQEYINLETGKKKYKILLEPFSTVENFDEADIPYRIVVGLDATKPTNLKLIYDKVECDLDGNITRQDLRYSETINAHEYFYLNPEESYVVDNSYNKKVYSVKKYNKKYSDVFSKNINSSGYNVFVPKKALADNRTYEIFNWRLVARSKQSVNLELVDYFANIEEAEGIKLRTVKAAVLYDSNDTTSYDNIEPYVFYRMQNSPFNFSKFVFENPKSQTNEKNEATYWLVDLNSVNTLEGYDVVTFCPTKSLSEKAKTLISNYVKLQNGTIIVDGSNFPSESRFVFSDIYINPISIQAVPTYYGYNEQSKILDENKNGGWNINSSIFESQNYGIFGLKKDVYRYLNSATSLKSFLDIGISSSSAGSVGGLFEFSSDGDALAQGNIIFTSFPFLEYCNSLYSLGGKSTVVNSNTGQYAVDESDEEVVSSVVEGPFKFFYNCISFAMYSRAYAGRSLDTRSSLFNFVGEWNSSWAMYSEALLDSEKEEYFTNIVIDNSSTICARDLTKGYNSIKDYYLESIYHSLPSYQRDKISFIDFSKVEFFIETTNPDIQIQNSTKILASDALAQYNIPTSYTLFKLNSGDQKAYAYSNTISPKINIPDGFGPYVVKEIPHIKSSGTRSLLNQINPVNYFQSYPFKFVTAYSYQTASDKPLGFSGDFSANIQIYYQGKGEFSQEKKTGTIVKNFVIKSVRDTPIYTTRTPPPRTSVTPGSRNSVPAVNIKSISEMYSPQGTVSKSGSYQWRAFDYTYDIENGNGPDAYAIGARGDYVTYIQEALAAGKFYKSTIDGFYGPATMGAVSDFQTKMKAHRVVYSTDGTVDSETKALLAHAIHNNYFGMQSVLLRRSGNWSRFADAATKQIGRINDIINSYSAINGGIEYKKINYSGVTGAKISELQDYVFFSVPDGWETVENIEINFGSWKNVTVASYGYSIQNHSSALGTIQQVEASYLPKFTLNQSPDANGKVTLTVNNTMARGAKHFYIHIKTNGQVGIGNAEGYSLRSITCNVKAGDTTSTTQPPSEQVQTGNNRTYPIESERISHVYCDSLFDQTGDRRRRKMVYRGRFKPIL